MHTLGISESLDKFRDEFEETLEKRVVENIY